MKRVRYFLLILVSGFSTILHAQNGANESPVGKFMRSEQRSYVVIAVILTILLGVVLYLVRLERKIGKLEKETKS